MSFSYSRYDRQQRRTTNQRNAWNYWLPVGVTVASAAIGLAVWAWNERRGESDYDEETSSDDGRDDPYAASAQAGPDVDLRQQKDFSAQSQVRVDETIEVRDVESEQQQESQEGVFSRVSGAIRRSPSPQQFFGGASKRVAAGAAAVGAVMGRGLTALKETDEDYQDHERWSDEAEKQSVEAPTSRAVNPRPKKKRMVCVVVSAAARDNAGSTSSAIEHASILSHLPLHVDASSIDLLVLIYAPGLTSYPVPTSTSLTSSPDTALKPPRTSSNASSFSNIAAEEADVDTEETSPQRDAYTSLQASALRLVPHPTHILPFTTPTGHVHLLRHLSPSLVYLQEELGGEDGENVTQIEGWVGRVVLVVGGEGLGADTETEAETDNEAKASMKAPSANKGGSEWWKDEKRVGLGRTEVVESERFEEDWIKRVGA